MKSVFKLEAENGHWVDKIKIKVEMEMTGLTKQEIGESKTELQNFLFDALRQKGFSVKDIKIK